MELPLKPPVRQMLLVAVLYYVTGLMALSLARGASGPIIVFPPAGVAIGAVMLWGYRVWPGVLLGTAAMAWSLRYPWPEFFVPLVVCPAVAVVVPWLLQKVFGFQFRLESYSDVLWVALGGVLAGALSAISSLPILTYFELRGMTWERFPANFGVWWLGDATGVLLLAPLFLEFRNPRLPDPGSERRLESLLALLLLAIISGGVFWSWLGVHLRNHALVLAPYPVLVWIGTRLNRLTAIAASLILASISIAGTSRNFGPFDHLEFQENLAMLAAFLITTSLTLLMLNTSISERRRIEFQLIQQTGVLQNILSHLPGAVYWKNQQGRYQGCNLEFARLVGLSDPAEAVGKSADDFPYSPAAKALDGELDHQILRAGSPRMGVETSIQRPDGSQLSFLTNKVPLHSPQGTIIGLVGTALDITTLKQAEQSTRQNLRRLHRIVDHLPAGAVYVEGESLHFNEAVEKLTGYTEEELPTRDVWFQTLYPTTAQIVRDRYELNRSLGFPRSREVVITRKDGEECWLVISCYIDEQGEIWLLHDTTERHKAEMTLRAKELELAHVTRLSTLGEMVAEIAHEINQPLYAISNFTSASLTTLENPVENWRESLKSWLEKIRIQAEKAGTIIRRLRQLAAPTPPQTMALDLREVLDEVLEMLEIDAQKWGIETQTILPDELPRVMGDRVQVQQILINLIMNAHEALTEVADQRQVTIRVVPREADVEIVVEDSGPGFTEEAQAKMFEAFYTTKSRGMGMGLPICRSLIAAHGGRLWTQSAEPHGAELHFTLPIETPESTAEGAVGS